MPTAASTKGRARRPWVDACALVLALAGCGDDGSDGQRGTSRQGGSTVGGAVVSTVNGHAISIADVQALMRSASLSARDALDRLQAEQLLMAEAERRGVAGPALDEVAVRASVQALLDDLAQRNTATEDELRAAYERDPRFRQPEKRITLHVLARAKPSVTRAQADAALAVAKKAIEDLRTLDADTVMARYNGDLDGVSVKTEELPPASRDSAFVKEYLDAAFSIAEVGVVPQPVRTKFGWHAIRVVQITAPVATPYDEAVTQLRGEITTKKQADAVSALLLDLRHGNPVQLAPDLNDKLSSVDGAETFR